MQQNPSMINEDEIVKLRIVYGQYHKRNGLYELLLDKGLEVTTSEAGKEGLKEAIKMFDISFTDINLPTMGEKDIIVRIKKGLPL